MVTGRRRWAPAGAAVASVAALLAVVAMASGGSGPGPEPAPPPPAPAGDPTPAAAPAPPAEPAQDALAPGRSALVTVAIATVWREPGVARPLDAPSLGNPVDLPRWIAGMSHEDKLWLVDHLVTQALYGERVVVREIRGDWARVVVTGQASHLDPGGYPGWIPTVQLRAGEPAATRTTAVVNRPVAATPSTRPGCCSG